MGFVFYFGYNRIYNLIGGFIMNLLKRIEETSSFLKDKGINNAEIGIILGSGLGSLADEISNPIKIKYSEIPNFLQSTVVGHTGQIVYGELNGKNVLMMQGRFHFYEGVPLDESVFPIRVMKSLGIEKLIVTNAAGGCNENFEAGDLMIINDHINFTLRNPLIGENFEELGPRFPDMSRAYDREFIEIAKRVGSEINLPLREGIYMWTTGPSYETPAEVKMAQIIGADAVGMSTVPEVIVAVHGGMRVLGISCITNMASGILDQPLNHEEVIETSERVKGNFIELLRGIIENI